MSSFGPGPKNGTSLQLARLVERVARKCDEKRLAQFSSMWLRSSTLYGSTASSTISQSSVFLRTSSKPYPRTLRAGLSKPPSNQSHSLVVACGLAWPRVEVFHPAYAACMSTTCPHLPATSSWLYADHTAVITTSRQPALLARYLETYLSDLERWLSKWRIAINVSKSSAMLFSKTGRRIPKPREVRLVGEPIQWVDDARYLGVTLDKGLTFLKHRSGKKESGKETGNAVTSLE